MATRTKTFDGVVGRKLTGLAVSKDGETTLRLTFENGDAHYVRTEGDCCSESWWADILAEHGVLGTVIRNVEEIALPAPADGRTRQEFDAAYGYVLTGGHGVATLIFRNSSNGYYGGEAYDWEPDKGEREKLDAAGWHEVTGRGWSA